MTGKNRDSDRDEKKLSAITRLVDSEKMTGAIRVDMEMEIRENGKGGGTRTWRENLTGRREKVEGNRVKWPAAWAANSSSSCPNVAVGLSGEPLLHRLGPTKWVC
jgi:hypothetical protein